MGADEVFRRAREACRLMDIATVYRPLRLFREAKVVIGVHLRDGFTTNWSCTTTDITTRYLSELRETLSAGVGICTRP